METTPRPETPEPAAPAPAPAAPTPPLSRPPPRSAALPRPPGRLRRAWRFVYGHHLLGSLAIVAGVTTVLAGQVTDRDDFARAELEPEVAERWGAPVVQPAPSVRAVPSGTVFTELSPLPLDAQHVNVDAVMNYRRRGLRFFSAFEFTFDAEYAATNRSAGPIDVAFVFPLAVDKSQVLLSNLAFRVDGKPSSLDLGRGGDRLLWTGRIEAGATTTFAIRYDARGLDDFVYALDPALPARDVRVTVRVRGGENHDFPAGVLSAQSVTVDGDARVFDWTFQALESGVKVGVVLPSVETWDTLIATMARRAWAPFLALLGMVVLAATAARRRLAFYEAWLLAGAFALCHVLLAYLAAFVPFHVAWPAAFVVLGAIAVGYAGRLFPAVPLRHRVGAWVATMVVPSLAVVAQGYTGLVYTLEALGALCGLMVLTTRADARALFDAALGGAALSEEA